MASIKYLNLVTIREIIVKGATCNELLMEVE